MEGILPFQLPFGLVRLKDPEKMCLGESCLRRIQDARTHMMSQESYPRVTVTHSMAENAHLQRGSYIYAVRQRHEELDNRIDVFQ